MQIHASKMYYLIAICLVAICYCNITYAEGNTCECPGSQHITETMPAAFIFSNGKQLTICGYSEYDSLLEQKVYSEFILHECGVDTAIENWDAVKTCAVEKKGDTLFIKTIDALAVGQNFELVRVPRLIEVFYFVNDQIKHSVRLADALHYDKKQIAKTLKQFEQMKWKTQLAAEIVQADKSMQLANQLMIAAISGSDKAEKYFYEFYNKFKPDGHFAEWYNEMWDILYFAKTGKERRSN